MRRVLVISQLPPPIHGSTVMTATLLRTLEDLGYEWNLVGRRFSQSVSEVGKFSLRKLGSAAWMPARLIATVVRFRPQVVIFFVTNRTFSFLVDWALSEVLRLFRVRRICYLHTVGFRELAERRRLFSWMVGRIFSGADLTVHLSQSLITDISPWVSESKVAYIPNAVVDRPAGADASTGGQRDTVLYLSNLIPAKGADTFIDLSITLAREFPDVDFIAAGATADATFTESLKRKVEIAGLSDRVRLPGPVENDDDKWDLLQSAITLVFPSTYPFETFGLVLAEALAAGTPVASYRVGGLTPLIDAAGAGVIVDVGDYEALEKATRSLLCDRKHASELGMRGRQLYEEQLAPERYTESWGEVLKRLVTAR